jgi:hypothetical protein
MLEEEPKSEQILSEDLSPTNELRRESGAAP